MSLDGWAYGNYAVTLDEYGNLSAIVIVFDELGHLGDQSHPCGKACLTNSLGSREACGCLIDPCHFA